MNRLIAISAAVGAALGTLMRRDRYVSLSDIGVKITISVTPPPNVRYYRTYGEVLEDFGPTDGEVSDLNRHNINYIN